MSAPTPRELVHQLQSGTEQQKQEAAYSLSTVHFDNPTAILEAGGIAPLVALVRNGTTDPQKEAAAHALSNLASGSPENQLAIALAGGIVPLVTLVRAGTTEIQKEAGALAIATIALGNRDTQLAIVQAGGIEPLSALVTAGTTTLQRESASLALACIRTLDDPAGTPPASAGSSGPPPRSPARATASPKKPPSPKASASLVADADDDDGTPNREGLKLAQRAARRLMPGSGGLAAPSPSKDARPTSNPRSATDWQFLNDAIGSPRPPPTA